MVSIDEQLRNSCSCPPWSEVGKEANFLKSHSHSARRAEFSRASGGV